MNIASILNLSGFSRLKLFMALSRTPHGLLDMATPALGALFWLGAFPSARIIFLGFITAFAGYTAVYALNDIVDYRVDKEKIEKCGLPCSDNDLDALYARHPLAQGLLTLRESILWTAAWGVIALLGAYALNPACALIFMLGGLAEAVYCLMLKVSYLRTAVSGMVKTAGGLAAVFAVTPNPSPTFLICLFFWLFFWEIGGQNVPNDWTDLKEDGNLEAETIPVRLGEESSAMIILYSLGIAILWSLLLFWVTPAYLNFIYFPGALLSGLFLLLIPAFRLYKTRTTRDASTLFNRASYYPLAMLVVVLLSSIM
ncbi:MAG: UbiA family prenyltransferase [Anaerolineaceae bacterium]